MPTRILVIDDEKVFREYARFALESLEYEVRLADGPEAGLAAACSNPPDAILLDVMMPGMDGYEVCRQLQANPTTMPIPVIMLTASDDAGLNRKAYEAGARACVPKPFRVEGLQATLNTILASKPKKKPSGTD